MGNYVSMKSEVVLRVGKWGKQTASRVSELEKNMAAEYDLEGKILQSVYLNVFATTGKQQFS